MKDFEVYYCEDSFAYVKASDLILEIGKQPEKTRPVNFIVWIFDDGRKLVCFLTLIGL
jgi:hypothetical protein